MLEKTIEFFTDIITEIFYCLLELLVSFCSQKYFRNILDMIIKVKIEKSIISVLPEEIFETICMIMLYSTPNIRDVNE